MPKFMKMLNNISRSQAVFRNTKINTEDLQSSHYAFVLAICRAPGRSQEDIARELCINKSTAARNINYLEEKGYVIRTAMPNDKRQFSVCPTKKMLDILPVVRNASGEWMRLLSEDIPAQELEIFNSVLSRMEEKARSIIGKGDELK